MQSSYLKSITHKFPYLLVSLVFSFTACLDDDNQPTINNTPIVNGGGNGNNEPDVSNPGAIEDYTILVQTPNLPNTNYNYANPNVPQHFSNVNVNNEDNTPSNNPITNQGATLGRVLFYDKNMSANNTISCASCHKQNEGFSDNAPFSLGFAGGLTGRNSMGLTNAKYYENGHFFWDERAASLEAQTLMPIQDAVEMGLNLSTLVAKISDIPYYESLFIDAFGSDEVTAQRISFALAQYVRSIVSYNTKFDQGIASIGGNNIGNTPFPNYTASENLGKSLFFSNRTNCDNCHSGVNFVVDRPENNGLDIVYADNGLGLITGNQQDDGQFKINSLRNIEHTQPYMHDGRFNTLEEVVEFYNSGVQPHPNLAQELRQGGPGGPNNGQIQPRRLNLSNTEKIALVDFLETLSDPTLIADVKFSDPF